MARQDNLEDCGRLVGELGEAGGERGGSSPALQVQHTEVLQIIVMIVMMMTVIKMMLIASGASQSPAKGQG